MKLWKSLIASTLIALALILLAPATASAQPVGTVCSLTKDTHPEVGSYVWWLRQFFGCDSFLDPWRH